jgi:hypothetical protein
MARSRASSSCTVSHLLACESFHTRAYWTANRRYGSSSSRQPSGLQTIRATQSRGMGWPVNRPSPYTLALPRFAPPAQCPTSCSYLCHNALYLLGALATTTDAFWAELCSLILLRPRLPAGSTISIRASRLVRRGLQAERRAGQVCKPSPCGCLDLV